ncbi:MAG TPA: hypothetical protein VGA44_01400 [Steroidobacteraceae bacterium]|jgi:hypothetical protein
MAKIDARAEPRPEPDWIEALRKECERQRSQASVAHMLGYSHAVINQALKGTYKGDTRRLEQVVRGAIMHATVDCPVVGELPRDRCIFYQGRKFAATNPMRVQLYRACKSCPNRLRGTRR